VGQCMTATMVQVETISVLVDWDNLERSFPGRNMAQDVAYSLRERVIDLLAKRFPSATEAEIRCYSGWVTPNGSPTRTAEIVRPKIERLSARVSGRTIRLECVDEMAVQGAPAIFSHLAGPRECRCPAKGEVFEQKMVDTLIVADAAALAEYERLAVVVIGDDIDLAPGLVMAGVQRAFVTKRPTASQEVIWLRRRPPTRQTRLLEGLITIEEW